MVNAKRIGTLVVGQATGARLVLDSEGFRTTHSGNAATISVRGAVIEKWEGKRLMTREWKAVAE